MRQILIIVDNENINYFNILNSSKLKDYLDIFIINMENLKKDSAHFEEKINSLLKSDQYSFKCVDEKFKTYCSSFNKFQNIFYLTHRENIKSGEINFKRVENQIQNIFKVVDFYNLQLQKLDIDTLMQNQIKLFEQVKKLSLKLVPIRNITNKTISLYSKYMVGLAAGGEHLEMYAGSNYIYIFNSYAKSYIVNSLLIDFSQNIGRFINVDSFIKEFRQFKDQIDDAENIISSICFFKINVHTLEVEGVNYGEGKIISSEKINSNNLNSTATAKMHLNENENEKIKGKLKPGERLAFISAGTVLLEKSLHLEEKNQIILDEYLHCKTEYRSCFNSLFFNLSRESQDEFLELDANIMLLEVSKNAIIEV